MSQMWKDFSCFPDIERQGLSSAKNDYRHYPQSMPSRTDQLPRLYRCGALHGRLRLLHTNDQARWAQRTKRFLHG